MHYEGDAFSKNGRDTMTPLQPGVILKSAYQKYEMSAIDAQEVRLFYEKWPENYRKTNRKTKMEQ